MCDCKKFHEGQGVKAAVRASVPTIAPDIPIAEHVTVDSGDGVSPSTLLPAFKFCGSSLREGCYTITFRPSGSILSSFFQGTLRVDRSSPDGGPDNVIVSGDMYKKRIILRPPIPRPPFRPPFDPPRPPFDPPRPPPRPPFDPSVAVMASLNQDTVMDQSIPIFPRSQYHSYLKITNVSSPFIVPKGTPCTVTLTLEQYDYVQPAAGTFKGSFPASPSRIVVLSLQSTDEGLQGRWTEGGVDRGSVTMSWVSTFFRRATVEIDTLDGAVAPKPVSDGAGGMEYFDTIYAKHGWDLTVVEDQVKVPAPSGVTPTECWSASDLHNLMLTNRKAGTDLDKEWKIHFMIVPAKLGCSRGVMYDTIGVPREGCASFSDDGYPSDNSFNFGAAENQKQRDVARAYLRSAAHEITHTFNQIHQEQETVSDNSIMTTTPSVADVLAGPTSGSPGVFPDQINLAVNTTVRNHLVHMPDPVVRPGGWPFASWFGSLLQSSDSYLFRPSELTLDVEVPDGRVLLGHPLDVSWTLTNRTDVNIIAPNDVTLEGLFASIDITDAYGARKPFRPYVIACDNVRLLELEKGNHVQASHKVFWNTEGFAFPRAGRYKIGIEVAWSAYGTPVGVRSERDIFVDFPTSESENRMSELALNDDVGKWVALGGGANHLESASGRISQMDDNDRNLF